MADGGGRLAVDPGKEALDAVYANITARRGADFMTYHPDIGASTIQTPEEVAAEVAGLEPGELREHFRHEVDAIKRGLLPQATFPIALLRRVSREEIKSLEAEGIVLSGVNNRHPHGGIRLVKKTASSLDLGQEAEVVEDPTLTAIMATGLLRPVTGLVSVEPSPGIPEKLEGLPRIPVNCVVAAVYNDGEWSQSVVLPDGNWVVPGFDSTALQYGQGAFEGGAAADDGEVVERTVEGGDGQTAELTELRGEVEVDEHGKITIFRPDKNAKRLVKSAERMAMPPISVDQYIQAIVAAVKNNKEFIPRGGKLYIRSFMVGLRGGTGIKPARQCLFAVEVSPYGDYMSNAKATEGGEGAETAKKLILQGFVHPRGEIGADKTLPNYGSLMKKRYEAQSAGYADIVLLNAEGFVQECSSNNLFKVTNLGDKKFHVATPSLVFNQLPGNTRESILEVLRDPKITARLGYEVEVDDTQGITEADLLKPETHGLFSSGTAAGITAFDGYETCGKFGNQDPVKVEYNDPETKGFIAALTKLLKDLRQGKVPGYEHWVVVVD